MRKVLTEIINSAITQGVSENFQQEQPHFDPSQLSSKHGVIVLVSFILVELLVLFFGKFLWNSVVVKLISAAKPATSIWQILGFSILMKMLTN